MAIPRTTKQTDPALHHQDIAIPISDYIHRQTAQTRQYHPQRFRTTKANSNIYKYNYFPGTITQWNSLPTSVYDSMTVECFKNCIKNVSCILWHTMLIYCQQVPPITLARYCFMQLSNYVNVDVDVDVLEQAGTCNIIEDKEPSLTVSWRISPSVWLGVCLVLLSSFD